MRRRTLSSSLELPCPFCGEMGEITIDEGGGESQTYIEDCVVCCKPRVVHLEKSEFGDEPNVWLERGDE